ncbi:MAG TPA: 2-oxoglutarate and iron-dependent oxygenase domain-containing protein [Candidatus Acidoferrum sp.]|jgi:isopenicillin N synthase-like dioxygenase|nr:2-oxoglutarate and iron-dependent oxygenase domain-containing protein [Candidatus Acidoferrum sp.]
MVEQFSLSELVTAAQRGNRAVLARLDAVCSETGVFALTDVPFPDGLIEQLRNVTLEFFQLPPEVKSRLQSTDGDQFVGWKGSENRNEFGFPDRKEMFHIGPRVDPTLPAPDGSGVVAPWSSSDGAECSLWPSELPQFRDTWHAYYRSMQQACTDLGLAMAAALGVDAELWRALVADNWADLAANFYPPVGAGAAGVRNAVHSDLTMFTVLYQDGGGGGGLHMQDRDGEWMTVPPKEPTFLVNIGELLTYLTSGRWWAVPHEVSEADPAAPGADTVRISIPFFYRPNDASTITPLLGPDAEVEPIRVGEWVHNRKLRARIA